MKKYKIDYGTKFKYFVSNFLAFLTNWGIWVFASYLTFILKTTLTNILDYDIARKVINIIFVVLLIVYTIIFILSFAIPKRVILTSSQICIRKNCINLTYINRGFNERILYQHIVSCRLYNGIYDKDIDKLNRRGKDYAVLYFERQSLVQITDKFCRKYYVPVQNPEEFVEEVNKRMQEAKASKLSD